MSTIEKFIEDNPELGGLWGDAGIVKAGTKVRMAWTATHLLTEIGGETGATLVQQPPFGAPPEPEPPPNAEMLAFDIGPQRLSPAAARGLWDAGFRKAIIGMWYADLDLTRSNLQVSLDQGFDLESYAYLHLGGNVADRMQRSISLGLSYGVHRCWMDWEDNGEGDSGIPDPHVYPVSRVKDLIWTAQNACEDYPNGHYSGQWWWVPVTGDAHDWADRPWWSADYDGNPDITVFTPYAGITTLTGKQFRGTHNVAGIDIDSSTFLG